MARYRSMTRFDPSHPPVLAIYCSDGRFTRPVEELAAQLGYPRMDTVTLPGGPAVLSAAGRIGGFAEADQFRKAARFLIRAHATRDVLLIAHQGCGYYAERYPNRTPEEIVGKQQAELRDAARWLASGDTPDVNLHLFFAKIAADHVEFEALEPK